MNFYHEILGMNLTTTYPGAYFFAAGRYHHHIATNSWLGTTSILSASPESIGLNHFGIELPNIEDFDRMVKHLAWYNNISTAHRVNLLSNAILMQDPDGIRIKVYINWKNNNQLLRFSCTRTENGAILSQMIHSEKDYRLLQCIWTYKRVLIVKTALVIKSRRLWLYC